MNRRHCHYLLSVIDCRWRFQCAASRAPRTKHDENLYRRWMRWHRCPGVGSNCWLNDWLGNTLHDMPSGLIRHLSFYSGVNSRRRRSCFAVSASGSSHRAPFFPPVLRPSRSGTMSSRISVTDCCLPLTQVMVRCVRGFCEQLGRP